MAVLDPPTIISPTSSTTTSTSLTLTTRHPWARQGNNVYDALSYIRYYVYNITDSTYHTTAITETTYHANQIDSSRTISSLAVGKTYNIVVQAIPYGTANTASEVSSIQVTVVSYTNCGKPTNLSVSTTSSTITLNWNAATNGTNNSVNSYDVAITSGTGTTSNPTVYGATTGTSYYFSNRSASTTYRVYVRAVADYNTSNWVSITATTSAATPTYTATAPTSVTASAQSSSTIRVSWNAGSTSSNNPITGYQIGYATSYSGTKTIVNVSGSSTRTKDITGLSSSTTYYFWVKTIATYLDSSWSSTYDYATTSAPATYGTCSITSFTINNTSSATVVASGTNTTGNWYYKLDTSSSAVSGNVICSDNSGSSNNTFTINSTFTAGTTYYLRLSRQVISGAIPANPEGGNSSTWTLSTNYKSAIAPAPTYTSCAAPTSVTCTRSRGTVIIRWSGASGGTNNSISSYGIIRNTTKSTSGAATVNSGLSSTSTSGSTTNSPSSNTYYYGVRTQGTAGSGYYSGYTWSDAIFVPSHPIVSIGSTITKVQMDSLYSYINGSSNPVTQYSQINASDGNTYKSGLTAGTTQIMADWYNNV